VAQVLATQASVTSGGRWIIAATEVVAARFVVVDAIDENAASLYEHYGFGRIPNSDRLIQKVSDIAAALSQA